MSRTAREKSVTPRITLIAEYLILNKEKFLLTPTTYFSKK